MWAKQSKRPLFPKRLRIGNKGLAKQNFLPVEPGFRQYVDSTHELRVRQLLPFMDFQFWTLDLKGIFYDSICVPSKKVPSIFSALQ